MSSLGPQKVDAILGFNEPNAGAHGPLISVGDAVAAWKMWFEPIAEKRNATHLVTPSTAHCACDGVNCSGGGGANSPTGCECQPRVPAQDYAAEIRIVVCRHDASRIAARILHAGAGVSV